MMPEGWTIAPVRDFGEVGAGRQRSPNFTEGEPRPYLRVANVFDGYIDASDLNSMLFTHAEFARYKLEVGDILLNEGQSTELVGRPAMYKGVPENCCFQNTLVRFKANERTDPDYALQRFRLCLYDGTFQTISKKTTSIAHLGVSRFAELKLAWPPLAEQKRIAKILSTWDKAIAVTEQLLANSQQQKKALMQQLLTGKKRFSGFKQAWHQVRLGDICKVNPARPPMPDNGLVSFVAMESVSEDARLIKRVERFYSEVEKGFTSFREQDVLVAKITPCFENGKGAYAEGLINGVGFGSTEFHVLRANRDIYPRLIYYVTGMSEFRVRGEANMQGSVGHRRVSTDFLKNYKLMIPSTLDEQRKIASALLSVDREIDVLAMKLNRLGQEKKALMRQLLTGKRRVKLRDKEAA